MKKSGYWGVGCLNMKTHFNYGSMFRTAQVLGADFVFVIGKRFSRQPSDTMKSWRHVPTYEYESIQDFNDHRPYGCRLVGIELMPSAIPIGEYKHKKQCAYLLGAEDHGLTNEALSLCDELIVLPGERSMNVAVAGSIVMYDRVNKMNT